MKRGDRVAHSDGGVGYVEAVDGDLIDVRWLTPHNKPSCVVSLCHGGSLTPAGDNVLPQPRSAEWWEQSHAFCDAIEQAINNENEQET